MIVAIIFANGIYYVFRGQFKSAEKLDHKMELNLYEKLSIYSMHIAICSIGWIYSPEATLEYIGMSFPWNRDKTIEVDNGFFLRNPTIAMNLKVRVTDKRIAFKDQCYSLTNPNHRLALAANPGFLSVGKEITTFTVPVHYPYCRNTHIGITDKLVLVMNENLFNYLEQEHWLHPFTVVYKATTP